MKVNNGKQSNRIKKIEEQDNPKNEFIQKGNCHKNVSILMNFHQDFKMVK